jgi:nucleotide-binding universal stress UspA family protein
VDRQGGRIVVGVDGSAASVQALRWAVEQARLTGGTVCAVTAWEYPTTYGWAPASPDDEDWAGATEKLLSETVRDALGDDSSVPVRTKVVEGQSARVLLDESAGADLLVVGSRGRGGFAGLLLGSVSQHCVQHANCPIVVLPPASDRPAAA